MSGKIVRVETAAKERFEFRFDDLGDVVEVVRGDGDTVARLDVVSRLDNEIIFSVDGVARRVFFARTSRGCHVVFEGASRYFTRVDAEAFSAEDAGAAGTAVIEAPMVGRVANVLVQQGDAVAENGVLVVVEAMKMEHQLRSPIAGRVVELACAEGDQVDMGQVLVRVENDETAAD